MRLAEGRSTIFSDATNEKSSQLFVRGVPTLAEPTSQMCTASQLEEEAYRYWCGEMRVTPIFHRKYWELAYILQILKINGMMSNGKKGLGFGVGTEPIPALLVGSGCEIVATDLPAEDARAAGWAATNQHVSAIESLFHKDICSLDILREKCSFRPVDMNAIPNDLKDYDFTWSSCAFEHLGSIENGLRFVEESVKCLKIGGIAVHTTELNLTSNGKTVDNESTVLFRKKDFEELAQKLQDKGHRVFGLNFTYGDRPLDNYIDLPPYSPNNHLKLSLGEYVTTSFGFVVRRGADS